MAIVLLEEAGATGARPPVHPDEIKELQRELLRRGPVEESDVGHGTHGTRG